MNDDFINSLFCCETATEGDLIEIAAIEEERFKDYPEKYDLEFLKKWYLHNPKMFLVVRRCNDRSVVGFTITVPICEDTYNSFLNGKIHDMQKFSLDDVLTSTKSPYYYFADICLSNTKLPDDRFLKSCALEAMMSGVYNLLDTAGVKHIVSTSITQDGFTSAKGMGFDLHHSAVIDDWGEVNITVLDVTDDTTRRIYGKVDRLRKTLKRRVEKGINI